MDYFPGFLLLFGFFQFSSFLFNKSAPPRRRRKKKKKKTVVLHRLSGFSATPQRKSILRGGGGGGGGRTHNPLLEIPTAGGIMTSGKIKSGPGSSVPALRPPRRAQTQRSEPGLMDARPPPSSPLLPPPPSLAEVYRSPGAKHTGV